MAFHFWCNRGSERRMPGSESQSPQFPLITSRNFSSLGLSFSKVLYLPKSRVLRLSSTLVYICRGGREGAISKWDQPLHPKANLQPDRAR